MNRAAVIALVVAAVVGTSGGVALAGLQTGSTGGTAGPPRVVGSGSPTTGASTPSAPVPTHSSTSDSPTPTRQPLLYATDRAIHDGSTVVPISGPHHVAGVTRVRDGWVVAEPTSYQDVQYDLWTVRPDGKSRDFAAVDQWDIDSSGTRAVGFDTETGKVTVWDLATGEAIATWSGSSDATGPAAFAGDSVYIDQFGSGQDYQVIRWNPETDKSVTEPFRGFQKMMLSPGGSYMAGVVARGGTSADSKLCLALRSTYLRKNVVNWSTCTYTETTGNATFSPDGMRLYAVPEKTDGFGPSEFDIIDASDGPTNLVGSFRAPPLTLGAEWDGNDHLFVYGADTDDPSQAGGGWIDRCDFVGHCTRLVTSKQKLVVGTVT